MFPIRTILCPTDFSDHSEDAFQVACALARDYGARLIVLHVLYAVKPPGADGDAEQGGSPWPEDYQDSLREKLARLRSSYPAVRLEHRLREGGAAEEILSMADEYRCDLIVMGTHGRTGLDRVLMGSVAEEVLRRARCPVLAVKHPPARQPREPVWAEYGLRGASCSRASRGRPGSVKR
jgi:nucleotide-binding universal stress UspA family protein